MRLIRNFIISGSLYCIFLTSLNASERTIANVDTASQVMVVAAHIEAVKAGLEILKMGGNAVDAAVASAFVIGVVEPFASGLGGGGGMLVYLNNRNKFLYLDFYVQAAENADSSYSVDEHRETVLAICVPGTPSGLITAVKQFGRLPLAKVIAPAIQIARRGIVVDDVFYEAVLEKFEVIYKHSSTREVYLNEGLPYSVGDTIQMPGLVSVLESLADRGEEFFYRGEFASKVVTAIQGKGGVVSEEDFANYRTLMKDPVSIEYHGYDIYSAPPPQSGITLLEILNIFENIPSHTIKTFQESAFSVHVMSEAIKRADVDRSTYLADPRFVKIPVKGLLSDDYAEQRYSDIDTSKVRYDNNFDIKPGDPWKFNTNEDGSADADKEMQDPQHTTHISVIDSQGNMVSLTQTLGYFFGCGFSVDGVIMNSSMSVFTDASPNKIEPNKRPISTIAPSIVMKHSKPFAIIGTPGGRNIFNTMAQLLVRLIDFQESPVEAVYAPRFSTRISSKKLTLENRFAEEIVEELHHRGYEIRITDEFEIYLGGIQLIYADPVLRKYIGVSDPRRGGVAQGY